jgi:hypothetical protein
MTATQSYLKDKLIELLDDDVTWGKIVNFILSPKGWLQNDKFIELILVLGMQRDDVIAALRRESPEATQGEDAQCS